MGTLRHRDGGRQIELRFDHVIGRTPADTVIDDARLSRRHALIHWMSSIWCVRDLGSVNGTWVDGRRLTSGVDVPVRAGSVIAFASAAHTYVLSDDSAPRAFAVRAGDQQTVVGEGGCLLIGEGDAWAELTRAQDGAWLLEDDAGTRRGADDGEEIVVGESRWTIQLPVPVLTTEVSSYPAVALGDVTIRFRVSRDWEEIGLEVIHGATTRDLGVHAHYYPIFLLARARLADADATDDPGWTTVGELTAKARMTTGHFNLSVFKVRAALQAAGVVDGSDIVERRARAGRVRLGTARIEVVEGDDISALGPGD